MTFAIGSDSYSSSPGGVVWLLKRNLSVDVLGTASWKPKAGSTFDRRKSKGSNLWNFSAGFRDEGINWPHLTPGYATGIVHEGDPEPNIPRSLEIFDEDSFLPTATVTSVSPKQAYSLPCELGQRRKDLVLTKNGPSFPITSSRLTSMLEWISCSFETII